MGKKLDELMRNSPINGHSDVLRWLAEVFELWGGSERNDVTRHRREIARKASNVTGILPQQWGEGEEARVKRIDTSRWAIRYAVLLLVSDAAGGELASGRRHFLTAPPVTGAVRAHEEEQERHRPRLEAPPARGRRRR